MLKFNINWGRILFVHGWRVLGVLLEVLLDGFVYSMIERAGTYMGSFTLPSSLLC